MPMLPPPVPRLRPRGGARLPAGTGAGGGDRPHTLAAPGKPAQAVTPEALRRLTAVTADVTFLTSRGEETARFTGARLREVLTSARLVDPKDHHRLSRAVALVTARDGYRVTVALGEIAPELEAKDVLVAYERDGAARPADRLPRLVVPGDRRGSRAVFAIARIDILEPEPPAYAVIKISDVLVAVD